MEQFPLMPEQASEHAYQYDALFWTITGLTIFFTILVVVIVGFMVTRYRKGSLASRKNQMDSHLGLELTWTGIPLVLAVGIFLWATYGFMKQRTMPKDGMEIYVIGKQWMWHLQHMNGIRENNELHVPVGVPIKFTMISQDVLHAMYLPEMRAQFHVVPGRYTTLHFTPTKIGEYKMLCAMHCGTQHSEMVGKVFVLSQEDYAKWLEKDGNRFDTTETMVQAGARLFDKKGCGNCHTGQDNERAPTLAGLIGRTRNFNDGSSTVANEEYVRESIYEPYNRITRGYINTMTAYKGQLTEEQVLQLTMYIKSLGSTSGAAGVMTEYEQPERRPTGVPGGSKNATDIANERKSAPATQFNQRGAR
jgi:cytochrome c oxidase subunit 2